MRAALLLLVLLGLITGGCAEEEPQVEPLRPVRSETARPTAGARVRTFSGTARAGEETELSFRVAGTIRRVDVKVGDTVRRGQLIAQLDPRDFELQVEKAQATLAQAEATARNAAANLDRVRSLWENGNTSQNDLDASLAQSQSAEAQVSTARKSLELARIQRGYTRLTAPTDGAIAAVDLNVNENAAQGQRVVLLTSGARLEVQVAMPEQLISQVREGDAVKVSFDALPGSTLDAVVTEVGVAATGAATTFPVTVQLTDSTGSVRSGMAAGVAFRFRSASGGDRFLLRPEAVGEDRSGRFVFVVETTQDADVGVVRRRSVEVGALTPEGLEVLSGIAEGDEVVTAGVRRLSDGQQVKLLPRETA